ncbi:MAG: tetraacyldisaccharide 4'-kinase [Aquificaceae bacterium]|nr:tetraacyldisaccharide 4'-kinase [Aquificaceae bacterium]
MVDLLNPYNYAIRFRNWLYDAGFVKTCNPQVPVISVGNLSTGGSGKSSLVRYIASLLSRSFHVCILSRGYRRRTKGTLLVSSGSGPLHSWQETGDEPFMLARVLPGVSLVVDEDRCKGASFALKHLKPDLFLLDDGFQHRRVNRDLNILLLKKKDFSDRLLPFGRLREPLSAIERADVIVLSYAELEDFRWNHPKKPTLRMYRENWRVVRSLDGVVLKDFSQRSFTAFAGLGDNNQFFRTLERLGIKVEERLSLPDHYHYQDFRLSRDRLYITTLKDAVKLAPSENLFYLDFDLKVEGLKELVEKFIAKNFV